MAVLKNIILAATLLTPFALAAPVTYTHTEIVWTTIEETTTVWLDAAAATPAPAATTSTPSSVPAAVFAASTDTPSLVDTLSPTNTPSSFATSVAAAPSVVTPSPEVAPASSSPSPTYTLTAPAVNVQPKDTASTSGTCEGQGNACVGDVTHWDGGESLSPALF